MDVQNEGGRPDWIEMESSEWKPELSDLLPNFPMATYTPVWFLVAIAVLVTMTVVGLVLVVVNP